MTDGCNDQRPAKALGCTVKSVICVMVGVGSNLSVSNSLSAALLLSSDSFGQSGCRKGTKRRTSKAPSEHAKHVPNILIYNALYFMEVNLLQYLFPYY